MVETRSGTDCTIIRLCNYDKYQSAPKASETLAERETERSRNAGGTNENKDARKVKTETNVSVTRRTAKTRIPPEAIISEQMRAAAIERGLSDAEAEAQFAKFRDWAVAKGQVYADWNAAWRNWITSEFYRPITTKVHQFPGKGRTDGSGLDHHFDALKARLAVQRLE
jgi:hypothetical protein